MLRNFSISRKELKCWTVMMLLQVKLQTQNADAHGVKYRNGFHCTTHILKTEGVCVLLLFRSVVLMEMFLYYSDYQKICTGEYQCMRILEQFFFSV